MDHRLKLVKYLIEGKKKKNAPKIRGVNTSVRISLGTGIDPSRSAENLALLDSKSSHHVEQQKVYVEQLQKGQSVDKKRIAELTLIRRLAALTPDGWKVDVPQNPGVDSTRQNERMISTHFGPSGGRTIRYVLPDIQWTDANGRTVRAEVKSVEPAQTKNIPRGTCGTFDVGCHGSRVKDKLFDLIRKFTQKSTSGKERLDYDAAIEAGDLSKDEYAEIMGESLRKNNLTIVKSGNDLHVIWPHGKTEADIESDDHKHVDDFLKSTGLRVTHLFDHVKKSGNPLNKNT